MKGRLTTHVLDTAAGVPAKGIEVRLYWLENDDVEGRSFISSIITNDDGRSDAPLLSGDSVAPGHYCLEFHVGAYLAKKNDPDEETFFNIVPVNFRVTDAAGHYHVPLLLSPFGYSTYRGS